MPNDVISLASQEIVRLKKELAKSQAECAAYRVALEKIKEGYASPIHLVEEALL